MRTVIQRVKYAKVEVENQITGQIKNGLLVLAGFEESDSEEDLKWTSEKICNLRIFDDEHGIMNRSVLDIEGEILCVSQFTLHAMTKKGNRPSYIRAAKGEIAEPLYENFCRKMAFLLKNDVKKSIFGANMQVSLLNDGPVTIIIDSKNKE